uniref:Uncharacterized protein n=1 Tax=Magnetococcus massalia (strain MO-1) TaxID=451514 RepID=A0A1S7LHE9_MAGMO|nr:Conserved membrane protein of unknown function. putative Glutamine ABC transporter, periplasmic glutamine-binding protein [Candidatus Magnetococcus massalia]
MPYAAFKQTALILTLLFTLLLSLAAPQLALAEDDDELLEDGETASHVVVGTIVRPPFVMKGVGESLTGFSIELWREVAREADLEYVLREEQLFSEMLNNVARTDLSMAIANISITAEREGRMDFSQPIYETGMQILVSEDSLSIPYWQMIWDSGVLTIIAMVLGVITVVAHLMWFFERGGQEYFRDKYPEGVWDAFWWAFTTCTMGGFEHARPKRGLGVLMAMIWIILGMFVVSTVTAKITTLLTLNAIKSDIRNFDDLKGKRIGVAEGTTFSAYMEKRGIYYRPYPDFNQALKALEEGEIDATVGDAAVARYYVSSNPEKSLALAGEVFNPSKLGIAMPEGSIYFERVNRALLSLHENGIYEKLKIKYFGTDG